MKINGLHADWSYEFDCGIAYRSMCGGTCNRCSAIAIAARAIETQPPSDELDRVSRTWSALALNPERDSASTWPRPITILSRWLRKAGDNHLDTHRLRAGGMKQMAHLL